MKPRYNKEDILESLTRIRAILYSSEDPLTRKEIKTKYELRYGETNRSFDLGLVNFKNFIIYTLRELLEIYPEVRKSYGMNPNTRLYCLKEEQIEKWVKKYSK